MEVLEGNQTVPSNNQKLYNNLIDSKRATVDEIGDFDTFNSMLSDSSKAVKLYQNLVKESRFKPEEIGTQEDFLLNIDPIKPAQPETEQPLTYMQKELRNNGLIQDTPTTEKGILPTEQPKEEQSFVGKLGSVVGNEFMTGLSQLNSWVVDAPNFIYDLAGAPFRAVGLNVPTSNDFKDTPLQNISDYYKNNSKAYESKVSAINPSRDKGIIGAFEQGDIKGGFLNLAGSIAESTPASIAMMLAGGATMPTILGGAAVFGAGKAQEIDQNSPEMNYDKGRIVAAVNGTLEGIFETYLGSGAVAKSLAGIIKNEGKDVAKQQIKSSFREGINKMLTENPWLAPLGEGFEEVGTQLAQNAVDKYSGYKPDLNLMDGVGDSFAAGFGMGGIHGAVIGLAKKTMEEQTGSQQPSEPVSADTTPQLTVNPRDTKEAELRQYADNIAHTETGKITIVNVVTPGTNENVPMFVAQTDVTGGFLLKDEQGNIAKNPDGSPMFYKPIGHEGEVREISVDDWVNGKMGEYDQVDQQKELLIKKNIAVVDGKQLILTGDQTPQGYVAIDPESGSDVVIPSHIIDQIRQGNDPDPTSSAQIPESINSEVPEQNNLQSVTNSPSQDNGLLQNGQNSTAPIDELFSQSTERKVITQTIGKDQIDFVEDENFDEVVPTDKMPLEKALPILEKKFKDHPKVVVVADRVQVEVPGKVIKGETKWDDDIVEPSTFKTVVKSIKIVPKEVIARQKQADTDILLDILDEFNATPQSRSDSQKASEIEAIAKKLGYMTERNAMNQIRLFDNSGTISKPKISENANIENVNQENVSETKTEKANNLIDTLFENSESSQNNQLQNEESKKVDQQPDGIITNEGENTPQAQQREGVQEGLEENVNNIAVPPVATISQTPGDSAYLIDKTTRKSNTIIGKAKEVEVAESDIQGLSLQYFVNGGTVHSDEILRMYRESKTERDLRRSYANQEGLTVTQIAHNIWESLPENIQNGLSEMGVYNEVESVIQDYNTPTLMAKELLKKYSLDQNQGYSKEWLDAQIKKEDEERNIELAIWTNDLSELEINGQLPTENELIELFLPENKDNGNQENNQRGSIGNDRRVDPEGNDQIGQNLQGSQPRVKDEVKGENGTEQKLAVPEPRKPLNNLLEDAVKAREEKKKPWLNIDRLKNLISENPETLSDEKLQKLVSDLNTFYWMYSNEDLKSMAEGGFIQGVKGEFASKTDFVPVEISLQNNLNSSIERASKEVERRKKQSIPLPEEKKKAEPRKPLNDFLAEAKDNNVRFRVDQGQTNTPEFKEWFGKSVFTENGKVGGTPLVLYHGTDRNFDSFRPDRMIYLTTSPEYANMYTAGQSAKGAHYVGKSEQELAAKTYSGESIMPVFARAENPFDTRNPKHKAIFQKEYFGKYGNGAPLDNKRGLPDWTDAEDLQEFFDEKGYDFDGLVLAESHGNITYTVFTPNQIKSATGNSGEFSTEDDDIRFRTEEQSKIIQDALKYSDVNDFIDAYKDADFRDSHSAPGNSMSDMSLEERMDQGDDFNLTEVVQGFSVQPKDYFDPRNGARWYGYDDKEGMQSYYAIKSVMSDINGQIEKNGKITKMPKIKAYRAVPKGVKVNDLIDGDWITFSKEYAKGHGENRFGRGEYKIISQNIPANDVWWDGNDINEWGYDTGKTEKLGRSDLKAIWENAHAANRFRILGETGAANLDKAEEATTRLDNLAIARKMETSGKDAKSIRLATGWEKGVDGKWRYEVPEGKMVSGRVGHWFLPEIYEDPELYAAYPQIRDLDVVIARNNGRSVRGSFNGNVIYIYADDLKQANSTLLHEIQHAIQDIEGFAKGGNTLTAKSNLSLEDQIRAKELQNQIEDLREIIKDNAFGTNTKTQAQLALLTLKAELDKLSPFSTYKRLAGEVESRNVQSRMNMTPEERRNTLLQETEDVAREDQIVLMEGLRVSNLEINNSIESQVSQIESESKYQTKINYLDNIEAADYLEGRIPDKYIQDIKNTKYQGLSAAGEIFINPKSRKNKSNALVTWIHEKTHIEISRQYPIKQERLDYFTWAYNEIGQKEIQRIIPEEYWNDPINLQAEEYFAFLNELIAENGNIDPLITNEVKLATFDLLNGFTTLKTIQDARTRSINQAQLGRTGRNSYEGSTERNGLSTDASLRENGEVRFDRSLRQNDVRENGKEIDKSLPLTDYLLQAKQLVEQKKNTPVELNSPSEIEDKFFTQSFRPVLLPSLPQSILNAIGIEEKPVLIKRSIFTKNRNSHKELSPEDSRYVLQKALYNPDLIGRSQPKKREYYWVAVKLDEKNATVVIDVYPEKDAIEIVGWRLIDNKGLERLKKQAEREDEQLLILSPETGLAAALSTLPTSLPDKDTNNSELPNTILIDGKSRSTLNSNGKPIANSEEGIRNFWKWFGDSKIVDENGRPLVVYHGGAAGTTEFDPNRAGSVNTADWGKGIYFTPAKWVADGYREDAVLNSDKESDRLYEAMVKRAKELGTTPMNVSIDLGFQSPGYNEISALRDKWIKHRDTAKKNGGEIYEAYLKIDNPLRHRYEEMTDPFLSEAAKYHGNDGIIVTPMTEYVVFEPSQIKSATGNNGSFNPDDNNINFKKEARPPLDTFLTNAAEQYQEKKRTRRNLAEVKEKVREFIQDHDLPIRRLEELVKKGGGVIKDNMKPYRDMSNSYGRNETLYKNFSKDKMEPVIKTISKIIKSGVSGIEVLPYMISKHAIERNAYMRENEFKEWEEAAAAELQKWTDANIDIPQATKDRKVKEFNDEVQAKRDELQKKDYSGVKGFDPEKRFDNPDELAQNIVDEFEDKVPVGLVDELWENVKEASSDIVNFWKAGQTMSAEQAEVTKNRFKYFIPLRGWREGAAKQLAYKKGDGFAGSLQRAKGRTSFAENPLAYLQQTAFKAIGEQVDNEVKTSLLNLVTGNYDTEFQKYYHLKKAYYVKVNLPDGSFEWEMTIDRPSEEMFASGDAKTKIYEQYQKLRTPSQAHEHEIYIKRPSGDMIVVMSDEMLPVAQAMNHKNTMYRNIFTGQINDAEFWNKPLSATIGSLNNSLKAMYTAWNVVFPLTNFARDIQEASITQFIKGDSGHLVLANYKNAFPAIIRDLRGKTPTGKYGMLLQEFRSVGGNTGFTHLKTPEELEKDIKSQLNITNRKGTFRGYTLDQLIKVKGAIEAWNQVFEDATRFSVYITSRENGKSMGDAASDAKEASVNFNRKGKSSKAFDSVWAFWNVAIQSMQKNFKIAKDHPGRFGIVAGSWLALGFLEAMLNDMAGGDDNKDYYNISDYVRENYLIIPNIPALIAGEKSDKYLRIPLSQFWRGFKSAGSIAYDVYNGKMDALTASGKAISNFLGGLLPVDVGGFVQDGEFSIAPLVPTIYRTVNEIDTNRDYMGFKIAKEPFTKEQESRLADSGLGKDNVNPAIKFCTDWLFRSGGGDNENRFYTKDGVIKQVPGFLDINPSMIEHLITGYTGGTGRFIDDALTTAMQAINPETEVDFKNAPFLNSFFKKIPESKWKIIGEYYDLKSDGYESKFDALKTSYFNQKDKTKFKELAPSGYYNEYNATLDAYDEVLTQKMKYMDYKTAEGSEEVTNTMKDAIKAIKEIKQKYNR